MCFDRQHEKPILTRTALHQTNHVAKTELQRQQVRLMHSALRSKKQTFELVRNRDFIRFTVLPTLHGRLCLLFRTSFKEYMTT